MIAVRQNLIATLVAVLATGLAPARANDSAAAIAAGGLELVKSDQVRMLSEVLRIAPRLIEVNYVFENTAGTDVTTLVAFPLPDFDHAAVNRVPVSIPFSGIPNFVGFQVWVDGREIKPDVEVRAFSSAGEITADLKRLGVDPINAHWNDKHITDELLRMQVLDDDKEAVWTAKVSFHWPMTFPAGKRVEVRHRYRPVFGSFYVPVEADGHGGGLLSDDKQWCPDDGFMTAERRLIEKHRPSKGAGALRNDISYDSVQYVLKTGANWRGPIGHFELQIDKAGADLISTCAIPGLRLQRAPYGFNAVASDYTPVSDLDILFVSGGSLGPPAPGWASKIGSGEKK